MPASQPPAPQVPHCHAHRHCCHSDQAPRAVPGCPPAHGHPAQEMRWAVIKISWTQNIPWTPPQSQLECLRSERRGPRQAQGLGNTTSAGLLGHKSQRSSAGQNLRLTSSTYRQTPPPIAHVENKAQMKHPKAGILSTSRPSSKHHPGLQQSQDAQRAPHPHARVQPSNQSHPGR